MRYHDSLAMVKELGKPSLFLTCTCNPRWPEIQAALGSGEQAWHRPDITAKVFQFKMRELLKDILERDILGHVIGYTGVIEFQKRGLPHLHLLLILAEGDRPETPEDTDKLISAELPDAKGNPRLYAAVLKHQVHGPCGKDNDKSPCMDGVGAMRKCTKGFPKEHENITHKDGRNYPRYKRRSPDDGGGSDTVLCRGRPVDIDNSNIVPFNAFLLLKYDFHHNLEDIFALEVLKYLYKYCQKGPDRVCFSVEEWLQHVNEQGQVVYDEIKEYEDGRYISASEAWWRILEYPIQHSHPPVDKLPVHLPGEHTVTFQTLEEARYEANLPEGARPSKLMAYFHFLQENPGMRDVKYLDILKYCVWDAKLQPPGWRPSKVGKVDAKGRKRRLHLARMPHISPRASLELFHLRMLLIHKAAASYEELRTVDGELCETFQSACVKLGLLVDDREQMYAMDEVIGYGTGYAIRQTFVSLLLYCTPASPRQFLEKYLRNLGEDFAHRAREGHLEELSAKSLALTLQAIGDSLESQGTSLANFGFPEPDQRLLDDTRPVLIREATDYDEVVLAEEAQEMEDQLTEEQREIVNAVDAAARDRTGGLFAISSCGGSGKTFVLNLLLKKTRARGEIALASCFTGIAASLLEGGRTIHSRFKAPLDLNDTSTCCIKRGLPLARLLQETSLLVFDEVTMGDRYLFEAVDRTLRDVLGKDKPFGGITTVFGGDWRQCLPVLGRGKDRADVVSRCLKSSPLWEACQHFSLTTNIRARNAGGETLAFANYLLDVGDGNLPRHENTSKYGDFWVQISEDMTLQAETKDEGLDFLIEFVFGRLQERDDGRSEPNYKDPTWLCSRAIMTSTNDESLGINEKVANIFPGQEQAFLSANTLLEKDSEENYPLDYLQSLTPQGWPPHQLRLTKHASVMLIRNVDPAVGAVNGARYAVLEMRPHNLRLVKADGTGRELSLVKFDFKTTEDQYPFILARRQFPIRLAYAMTVNKSQGQTMKCAGIHLPRPLFSHGQLYTALSRCGSRDHVKVHLPNGTIEGEEEGGQWTANCVWPEVLED